MAHPRLAVAAGNQLGAMAAANVGRAGGNAVDACLASAITAWVGEPFFASIGGSGYVVVRAPDGTVEVIDGNNTMPVTPPAQPGQGLRRIFLPDYADGIYMGIGGGSVAVPGILAAIHLAWLRHGQIEWPALFSDAIRFAREGIAFPQTSDYYLSCTWNEIWSQYPVARELLSREDVPLREGELLIQSELGDSLEMIADQGPDVFYATVLAEEIAQVIQDDGGFMTVSDLHAFRPEIRTPIVSDAFGWRIHSNPPPAVGGAVLTHMLALIDPDKVQEPEERLRTIVEAQRAAVGYRLERYSDIDEVASAFEEAVTRLRARSMRSPSTTHSSAADAEGYVCSITESNGYGAGLVVRGMLLNNTLGEEELNPLGVHRLPPGSRCHSNMAPTIAGGPRITVGLGSPGADRIVGAIAQTLIHLAVDGDDLAKAVASPRAHLDPRPQGETLCFEPGLPGDDLGYIPRPYDGLHMYFGGVNAASVRDDGTVDAAHDPRRSGGTALV